MKYPLFYRNRHAFLLLFLLSVFPLFAFPQTYSFKHYSSADGLELASVNTIFQDSRGSLWFGGIGGAFRYDGYKFNAYISKGKEKSVVTRFAEDNDGTIWAATEGNGIAKIRYGSTHDIVWMTSNNHMVPSDSVYALLRDSSGVMYVGTRRGVKIFWKNGTSTMVTKDSGLYSNWTRMMIQDRSGNIWIGTNGGVTRYTIKHSRVDSWKKIHDATTIALTVRNNGTIVIGTIEGKGEKNKGVFEFRNDTLRRIIDPDTFSDPIKTQALLEDSKGTLWIGTTRGIILKHPDVVSRIRSANGLMSEAIGCILEDRDGSIWCATGNGIVKLPRRYMVSYKELQGISGILTVFADRSNTVWSGGFSPLYKIASNNTIEVITDDPRIKNHVIFCIAQDLTGTVWFGTQFGLLMRNGKSFERQSIGNDPSTMLISSLAADTEGGVWVGLKGEIINIRQGKVLRSYRHHPNISIPDEDISTLMVDGRGRLWFGTDRGCGMIDNGVITVFGVKDGLPSDDVERIKGDSKGRIWFVTGKGIAYFANGKFHRLTQGQFPDDDSRVTMVHEDLSGHLWFGTMYGAVEWSDSVIARYDTRDGLSGDIIQAITEESNGDLWFATGGGLTKFPRSGRMSFIPKPSLSIERISDEETQNNLTAQTILSSDERTVTFQAVSLSFYDERNMEFQYKLDGIEQEWNPVTKQRIIRYTTLPSGEYTLFVRARNRNGEWTEPSRYSFTILPPFWKTWWFISLAVFVVAGLTYLFIRQRFIRLEQEAQSQQLFSKQLMEVYETERKRIASELHDGLGQNLLIIANRAKMGLKKNELPLLQKELENISDAALESISDVRKITYNLHPLQIEEVGLTNAVESMLKRIASLVDTTLTFTIENIDEVFSEEKRIHFYRIIQETINNAIKHSDAGEIEVTVIREERTVRVIIKDNGKGFNPAIKKEGYGMRSLNERMKIFGGTYDIQSSPGAGTVIKISIPFS